MGDGNLKGESRYTARTLNQHGLSRLGGLGMLKEGVPGGQARTGKGGGFLVTQLFGKGQKAVLIADHDFGQHTIGRTATAGHIVDALFNGAVHPQGEKEAHDPVAHGEARYGASGLEHFAGPVREGDDGFPGGLEIEDVAVVEGSRMDTDLYVVGSEFLCGDVFLFNGVFAGFDLILLHRWFSLRCSVETREVVWALGCLGIVAV